MVVVEAVHHWEAVAAGNLPDAGADPRQVVGMDDIRSVASNRPFQLAAGPSQEVSDVIAQPSSAACPPVRPVKDGALEVTAA